MKRSSQFAALMLLVGGLAFVGGGCQSDGDKVDGAASMPDDQDTETKTDHPKSDHPKGEHPSEHPSDHPG